jgi:uncharacterized protein YhdP
MSKRSTATPELSWESETIRMRKKGKRRIEGLNIDANEMQVM